MNFQLPLETSDAEAAAPATLDIHVDGVTALLDFVSTARHHPRLIFISSLTAVLRCKDKVPEHVVSDHDVPESSGYAQSKWMGEQIIEAAAQSRALVQRPMIVRMGQIAGPLPHVEVQNGSGSIWDPRQTVPNLVLSSKTLGALPASLGEKMKLRRIPVDICARIILNLAGHADEADEQRSANVYNITKLTKNDGEVTRITDILPLVKQRLDRRCQTHPRRLCPYKNG